jgi:hypothetical protein
MREKMAESFAESVLKFSMMPDLELMKGDLHDNQHNEYDKENNNNNKCMKKWNE